ncbi:uncharacterized protein LOC113859581 [Abrus precatorius]|uniref:Uncharacterized protein LOC113859581 n=1 Tax=Abrus precatorius TaxID=3816 RepID=A0A8B8KW39_ABRPR|nr:uncharacterized protein LOC113859581 [Abrus precatorius]
MASRGRGARGTNDLMKRMTQILETLAHNQGGEPAKYRGLSTFTRHNPLKFERGFNPEGAQRRLADVEKIFNALECREEHKVNYAAYMLCGEAEDWWRFVSQTLPQEGNYFLRDLKKQKAKEFLELKQGSMTVGEYAVKFQELIKYWPHYHHEDGEKDLGPIKCFKCGGPHIVRDCPQSRTTCGNYGKSGHTANATKSGSASTAQRLELRGSTSLSTGTKPSIPGRVFSMSGAEASQSEELIRGKCVIKGKLLDLLFDSGATHSFVSVDCVKSLGLYVTELPCNVVVTTRMGKLVVTSWVCLQCSIMVHGRIFEVDLICLPLS